MTEKKVYLVIIGNSSSTSGPGADEEQLLPVMSRLLLWRPVMKRALRVHVPFLSPQNKGGNPGL